MREFMRAQREKERLEMERNIAASHNRSVLTDKDYQALERTIVLLNDLRSKDGLLWGEHDALHSAIQHVYRVVNASYTFDVDNPVR